MDTATAVPADPGRIRIVQITDTHIFADPDARFDGVDTAASLRAVLASVAALAPRPDLVLATGDLVNDPEPAAYRRLLPVLQGLGAPVYCLPGNHDAPALMRAELDRGNVCTARLIDAGAWRIVLLNDYLDGSDSGFLHESELEFLHAALAAETVRHVLLAVHHPPLPVGSRWMDAMMLENGEALLSVVDASPRVRAVVFGHIHQEFDMLRNGVRYLGAPSTCVQFRPGVSEYHVDEQPPGFRLLELMADGAVATRVSRLARTG